MRCCLTLLMTLNLVAISPPIRAQSCMDLSFTASTVYSVPCVLNKAYSVDFNGDGALDVILASRSSTAVLLFEGDGSGGLGTPVSLDVGIGVVQVAWGDFDNDADLDLLLGGNGGTVILATANSAGAFGVSQTIPTNSLYSFVDVGDLNGDGHLDFVVTRQQSPGPDAVVFFAGDGLGGFAAPIDVVPGARPDQVAIADVDGDGIEDLVVGCPAYLGSTPSLRVYPGTAGGTVGTSHLVTTEYQHGFETGDLNSDGVLDFVITHPQITSACGGPLGIYLSTGVASYALSQQLTAGCGPFAPRLSDLDQDGHVDLLYAYRDALFDLTVKFDVMRGDGAGGFGAACTPIAGPTALVRYALGDFNADTTGDLVAPPGCSVAFPSPPGTNGAVTLFLGMQTRHFERGDCNDDASVNIADAVWLLSHLFPVLPSAGLPCAVACDANDDDAVNLADAIAILNLLFSVPTQTLPQPHGQCGSDPTPGVTPCDQYSSCP